LIFRSIDIRQVAATVADARFGLLAAAVLLMFCGTSLAAYRWHLIMNNLGLVRSLGFHWRSYFKGMFFNQGLPTSVGGDAIRVLDAAGRRYSKLEALYGVLLDRIAGVAALITLNLLAYAIYPDLLPDWVRSVVLVLAAGLIAAFVAGLNLRHLPWLDSHPRLATLKILSERFHQAFAKNRFALIAASLVTHVFATFAVYAIARSLGLTYGVLTYFILVLPALLFTVIPISLAGWGVREGAMVALFSFIGADKAPILAMSILYGLVLIVVSLTGFVIFLRGRTAATELVIPSERSEPRDPLKSESDTSSDHSPEK
jgi:uncharacterized membrane protein YbhN (UPF0104 family)